MLRGSQRQSDADEEGTEPRGGSHETLRDSETATGHVQSQTMYNGCHLILWSMSILWISLDIVVSTVTPR